ncbi:LOW QUALITY PROTEIN: hyaluronidase-4 [Alca torda]
MKILPENGVPLYIIHLSAPGMAVHSTHLDFLCYETSPTTGLGEEDFHSHLTDLCSLRYDVVLNLEMSCTMGSALAKARGQNMTIFYFNRIGYYPWYTSQEVPVNGGLPHNFSLQTHLEKTVHDINCHIPAKVNGLSVTDWEHRPQWDCNQDAKDVYRRISRKLITEMEGNNSANDVEHLARLSFEDSARAFMKETIALGMKSRPKVLWGCYLYPDCHNYSFCDQNYTGSCQKSEVLRNNELSWLWDSFAALYPSIGIKKSLENSQNILHFSQFRVNESIRITSMTTHYASPVFVYPLGYRDEPLLFLSMQDLINSNGESALGAAGIVIWWDMNLTSSESNCAQVPKCVGSELGPYIINVTAAAEACTRHLCQGNGCV